MMMKPDTLTKAAKRMVATAVAAACALLKKVQTHLEAHRELCAGVTYLIQSIGFGEHA